MLSRASCKLCSFFPRPFHHTISKQSFSTRTTAKMRLPYAATTPNPQDADETRVYETVLERRAPRPLQPLDLTLLHAPLLAEGYNAFLGAVRTKNSLPASVRELAISRIAVLNSAPYEWSHHAPLALSAGISQQGLELISRKEIRVGSEGLGEKEWAVVRYTDAMTRDVTVPAEVFAELRRHFVEKEVVELTVTIAAYNAVSRILVALDVGEKNGTEISADLENIKH